MFMIKNSNDLIQQLKSIEIIKNTVLAKRKR